MKRYIYLDNISGVLILWMIFIVHCAKASGISGSLINEAMLIMEFFMPWFFYKSGMLFHEKPFRDTTKKNIKVLLKPFAVFSFLGWFIIVPASSLFLRHQSLGVLFHDTFSIFFQEGFFRGNPPLWFLLSFFIVKELFSLSRYCKIPVIVVAVISLFIAFLHNHILVNSPAYVGNISNGLFFFSIGYLLRDLQYRRKVFFLSLLIAIVIFPFCSYLDFRANKIYYGSNFYLINELFMVAEIVIVNFLMKKWGGRHCLFTSIGRDSILYFATHYIFLSISWNALHLVFHIENPNIMFLLNSIVLIISLFFMQKIYHKGWLDWAF